MKKVLIIEDNTDNAYFIRYILDKDNYVVDVVDTGRDALKKCAQTRYDCVIIDLQLPDISGEDVALKLRAYPEYQNIPLLAYTANMIINDDSDSYFTDVLTKPVLPDVVRKKVRQLFA